MHTVLCLVCYVVITDGFCPAFRINSLAIVQAHIDGLSNGDTTVLHEDVPYDFSSSSPTNWTTCIINHVNPLRVDEKTNMPPEIMCIFHRIYHNQNKQVKADIMYNSSIFNWMDQDFLVVIIQMTVYCIGFVNHHSWVDFCLTDEARFMSKCNKNYPTFRAPGPLQFQKSKI